MKKILLSGELKPDEWPKFRAILQELWRPEQTEAAALLNEHRRLVRRKALSQYIVREIAEFCREKAISPADLADPDRDQIERTCADRLVKGLRALGAKVSAKELLRSLQSTPNDQPE